MPTIDVAGVDPGRYDCKLAWCQPIPPLAAFGHPLDGGLEREGYKVLARDENAVRSCWIIGIAPGCSDVGPEGVKAGRMASERSEMVRAAGGNRALSLAKASSS